MPMFKALKLCPDAVVIRPRMEHYVEVSRAIRAMMLELTPLVEPLSLDEAFLDLTGTERLHRAPPAVLLARLQTRIEAELGITASVGLSHNKFLAKIASDLDKPRGFKLIGRAETDAFLARAARLDHLGRRPGHPHRPRARGHPHHRRPPRPRPQDPAPPLRQPRRPALPPRPRRGRPRASPPTTPLKSISHETTFADGHRRPRHPALAPLVALRAGLRPRQGPRPGRRHRHPEAQAQRPRPPHPPPDPGDARPRWPTASTGPRLPMLRRDIAAGPFRLIGIGLAGLTAGPWIRDRGRPPRPRGRPPPRSRARRRPDSRPLRTRFDHAGPLNPLKAWPARRARRCFFGQMCENCRGRAKNLACAG